MSLKYHVFIGHDAHLRYLKEVQANWPTVSPGGAAAIIHCSREFIHQLVRSGEVEAWVEFTDATRKRAGYMEVSLRDVVMYGLTSGRIKKRSDIGLGFSIPEIDEMIEEYLTTNK